jgi:PBP1b-binding outer membrane lipoprotein LpoB
MDKRPITTMLIASLSLAIFSGCSRQQDADGSVQPTPEQLRSAQKYRSQQDAAHAAQIQHLTPPSADAGR